MPIDFFAEGADEETLQFTKQENQFLNAKLVFLDPRKTYRIPFGNVLSLLKFSGLQPQRLNKIIHNCSIQGDKKTISYDEMKKIFRGIALAQNKIQPSKINIEANIKCKMPIFHDQSDDEQQQKPSQKSQNHPPHPPTNQTPVRQTQGNQQTSAQFQNQDPIKMFNQYWATLKTKNHTIDGTEVKKICGTNQTNKANLSKSWKLCNLSQKGCLTKGQFFIFMNMINSTQIPTTLTKEMKDFIIKMDKQAGYKKLSPTDGLSSSNNNPGGSSSSSGNQGSANMAKKTSQVGKDLKKSQFFEKFGQSSVFQKPKSSNTSNIASSKTNISEKNDLLVSSQSLSNQIKKNQQQILNISKNTEQTMGGLSAVQQFVNQINNQNLQLSQQINTLKESQLALTQRLNAVCISMRDIISKQQSVIVELVNNIHEQNQINQNRLSVIQSYTSEVSQSLTSKTEEAKYAYVNAKKSTDQKFNKIRRSYQQNNNNHYQEEGRHSDPFADEQDNHNQKVIEAQYKQEKNKIKINPTLQKRQNAIDAGQINSKSNISQNRTSINQQPQSIDLRHLTPEQILKMKQMQLIQLVNYLTPIKQEQYPDVVKRITSMTEEQMNSLYAKLHEMYLKKEQQNKQQQSEFPNSDEFNTSQFIDENTLKKAGQQNMGMF